jgi:hypothetical protein
MASLLNREIFKVGKWRGSQTVEADAAYLADMVQSYADLNSKVPGFAVPIKLGHNKRVGEPAFGYAENIHLSEDGGTVLADFNDMDPEIVDQITKKKYNTVSVEIWPQVNFEGKSYPNVLSGVALLGAEWPAVKGLKPLSMFSEQEAPIQLSQEEVEMKTFSEADHETLMAAAVAAAVLAEQAKVTAAEQRADTAEAALAAFTDEAEKASVAAVIAAAEAKGQIVPANKASVVAMAEALRLSVEPAKRKAALATFTAFVEAMPAKVKFGEHLTAAQEAEGSADSAGARVDTAVKALLAADKNKTYRVALDEVFAADPALKTAYAEENR